VSSNVAGSAVYVYSVHVYPQSRDLNQIQSTLSTLTIMSMKNSNDTIGNRTQDLPACSAGPQPTAPPGVPNFRLSSDNISKSNVELVFVTEKKCASLK